MIWCKREWMLLAAALAALAFCTASANGELLGPNGIVAPTGINPTTGLEWAVGDTYRLVFVTSTKTTAESSDIAYYNTFVNAVADLSTLPGVKDVIWYVIGSTSAASAIANTGTAYTTESPGFPVYLLDGTTKIADSYKDLWKGSIQNFIDKDQNASSLPSSYLFTGATSKGELSGAPLGGNVDGRVVSGRTAKTDGNWASSTFELATKQYSLYALSEPLTIPIPEPGTLALLGMALVAVAWWQNIPSLAWHAWRKAAKKGLARLLAVWLLCNALLGIGWWAWRSRGVRA